MKHFFRYKFFLNSFAFSLFSSIDFYQSQQIEKEAEEEQRRGKEMHSIRFVGQKEKEEKESLRREDRDWLSAAIFFGWVGSV